VLLPSCATHTAASSTQQPLWQGTRKDLPAATCCRCWPIYWSCRTQRHVRERTHTQGPLMNRSWLVYMHRLWLQPARCCAPGRPHPHWVTLQHSTRQHSSSTRSHTRRHCQKDCVDTHQSLPCPVDTCSRAACGCPAACLPSKKCIPGANGQPALPGTRRHWSCARYDCARCCCTPGSARPVAAVGASVAAWEGAVKQ
jgi:hypothetical protein